VAVRFVYAFDTQRTYNGVYTNGVLQIHQHSVRSERTRRETQRAHGRQYENSVAETKSSADLISDDLARNRIFTEKMRDGIVRTSGIDTNVKNAFRIVIRFLRDDPRNCFF